jgi:hypothetical protein
MELSLEDMLPLLEDKVVQTSQGPYISVKDLQQLQQDFKEAKTLLEPTGKAKTLHGARAALKQDPDFLAEFEKKLPKAPADADVVKPVAVLQQERTGNEAA